MTATNGMHFFMGGLLVFYWLWGRLIIRFSSWQGKSVGNTVRLLAIFHLGFVGMMNLT